MLRLNDSAHIVFPLVVFRLDTACESVRSGPIAITCTLIMDGSSYLFGLLALMLGFLRPHVCLLLGTHTRRQQHDSQRGDNRLPHDSPLWLCQLPAASYRKAGIG
jgi:hypothetical protein